MKRKKIKVAMKIPLTDEQSDIVSLMWETFMQPRSATFGQVVNIGCSGSVLNLRVFTPEQAKKINEVLESFDLKKA
jgi:hypothetical protein